MAGSLADSLALEAGGLVPRRHLEEKTNSALINIFNDFKFYRVLFRRTRILLQHFITLEIKFIDIRSSCDNQTRCKTGGWGGFSKKISK